MRLISAGLATVAAMAVLAAPAAAATKTKIKQFVVANIQGAGEPYEAGVILDSSKRKCIRGRKVTFFRKGDGRIGSARTNSKGEARESLGESDREKLLGKYSVEVKKDGSCSGAEESGKLTPTEFHP